MAVMDKIRRRDSAGQDTLDSTVAELEELLTGSKNMRSAYEPDWFLNLAFLVGNQWVAYDGGQLFEPELEEWRAKLVDNRILPSVRREIAKMTKADPVWVGVPKDQSDREIANARLRECVFEHYWRELSADRKLLMALRWSRTCGAGFWKFCWDPTKGKAVDLMLDGEGKEQFDEYGRPITMDRLNELPEDMRSQLQYSEKRVHMGDPMLTAPSPFAMFPDDLADDNGLESCSWIIEEGIYSPDYIARRYGKELEPDAVSTAGVAESRMRRAVGGKPSERKNGIRLREFWALPGSLFPRGRWVVWARNEVLYEDDNPYPWLPYGMFPGIPVPGRFWPTSIVEQERSPQTERNKRLSQLSENADRIGNPPLRVPSSAADEDDIDDWQGLPGEKLVFDDTGTPNSQPSFLDVPELPSYIFQLLGLSDEAIREISSQHEVSAASVPAGVTAASAINLLLEQDDTVLGPDIKEMNAAITTAGRGILWMLSRFASDERIARITGPEGLWDFETWRGSDLGDCVNDSIQVGSGVPQSKAAKQAALQDVLSMISQNPNIGPLDERSLRRFLQEYQVAGLEQLFARVGVDERQVARENQRLASGEQLDINGFDDDAAHIAGHEEFQKGSTYAHLDDITKAQFQAHVDLHKQRQLAAATAMAPGAVDAPPPPAAPALAGLAQGGPNSGVSSKPSTSA